MSGLHVIMFSGWVEVDCAVSLWVWVDFHTHLCPLVAVLLSPVVTQTNRITVSALFSSAQLIVLLLSLTPVSNTRWCSSVLCLLQRGKECCRIAQVFSTQSVWDAVQRGCMGGGQRCCLHVRHSPPFLSLIAHNIAVLTCS